MSIWIWPALPQLYGLNPDRFDQEKLAMRVDPNHPDLVYLSLIEPREKNQLN